MRIHDREAADPVSNDEEGRWPGLCRPLQGTSGAPPTHLYTDLHFSEFSASEQNLFAVDDRFAFPNVYQVTYPHTFLCTEAAATRLGRLLFPRKRLQDNMRFGFEQPSEDELALCITTFRSEMLSLVFPRRADHYDRYLTLRGVPEAKVAEWKDALLWFTKKLTWKCRKPLVLKSPHHTGRIRRNGKTQMSWIMPPIACERRFGATRAGFP